MTGVRVEMVNGAKEGQDTAFVGLADGGSVTADAVVVATDGPCARQLLSSHLEASPSKPQAGVGTSCLYYR